MNVSQTVKATGKVRLSPSTRTENMRLVLLGGIMGLIRCRVVMLINSPPLLMAKPGQRSRGVNSSFRSFRYRFSKEQFHGSPSTYRTSCMNGISPWKWVQMILLRS